jgi:hypothetical protein
MRRKRKRRSKLGRLKPAPTLVLLVAVNVALGLEYSPVTTMTKVSVYGAAPFDRPRLEKLLQDDLKDLPCVKVNPRIIEGDALQAPEALDSDFQRNLFGRAELKVKYRVPVARMAGFSECFLDTTGVVYPSRMQPPGDLPTLVVPNEFVHPVAMTVNPWPSTEIAEFCQRLPKQIDRKSCEIRLLPRGELCLNIGQAERIVFGSATELEEKMARLESLFAQNPSFLWNQELNLTSPSRPALRPLAPQKP